ncbi:MAG TPA: hypothetical protein VGB18_09695, partial [Candidatus Thermoplasmatota archaeon]
LLAIGYGVTYLVDPKGTDGAMLLVRASVAVAGGALLAIARGVARNESPRIKSLFSLGATGFVAGLADATFLLFDAATNLPDVFRTLMFLFMGILAGIQVLLLLRRGKSDKDSVPAFFAQHAAIVAFLLFLIVTRIALKDLLRSLLPALFLNLLFLIAFLSGAIYLIARFLGRFGSPISWGDAKRHEQTVERLSDMRMEDVRELLKQYINTGRKLPEYQEMVRTVMQRVEANPGEIEPLLVRAPAPLRPSLSGTPTGILLLSTFLIAAALGLLAAALYGLTSQHPGVWIIAILTMGASQPMISALVRFQDTDPAPGAQYWLSAAFAGSAAAILFLLPPMLVLPTSIGGLLALAYAVRGTAALFKRKNKDRGPDQAYLRAQAATAQVRRARGLMLWGAAVGLAAPAWSLVSWIASRWIHLGYPPLALTIAGLIGGALFLAGGSLLGPFLAQHREEIRGIHQQETGLRQSYHRVLVKKLEGART